ncbi:XcyI family restriction endonuclease [Acidobacteria bacterium AH-259-O06]|nr:XcyI family restriction endonuclease [Acidobacteria bacterium AH-259-O06]
MSSRQGEQFRAPRPELQITFYHRLCELRDVLLLDALLKMVSNSDIEVINEELSRLVGERALSRVASWGLRGEILFAVPSILRANPYLLGYYRLLLGFSQKQSYGKTHGFGSFKSMEERGTLSEAQASQLQALCAALCQSGEYLVNAVQRLDRAAVHELTLLTLGPQLRGGALNLLGAEATERVFDLIKTHVAAGIVDATSRSLKLKNAASRLVTVEFSTDPDISIREELMSGTLRNLVAIEIKGGRDVSNIHNRIGEAEKSHQKAREKGFVECWTLVGVHRLDLELARRESPSTDCFFRIEAIAKPGTPEFKEFREQLLARVGLQD